MDHQAIKFYNTAEAANKDWPQTSGEHLLLPYKTPQGVLLPDCLAGHLQKTWIDRSKKKKQTFLDLAASLILYKSNEEQHLKVDIVTSSNLHIVVNLMLPEAETLIMLKRGRSNE